MTERALSWLLPVSAGILLALALWGHVREHARQLRPTVTIEKRLESLDQRLAEHIRWNIESHERFSAEMLEMERREERMFRGYCLDGGGNGSSPKR